MNKPLNEKISELRKARSLTQEKLGEQLGITSQAVSRWEKGETMPDIMLLPQLCQILGISIDALLEMPSEIKKDNLMKDLGEQAENDGITKTIFDAFLACEKLNDCSYVTGTASSSKYDIHAVSNQGIGFVLHGEEIISQLQNMDEKYITSMCDLLGDKNTIAVIKALSFCEFSEEELAQKSNIPVPEIEIILFKLLKHRFCQCNASGKYVFGNNAYSLFAILAGIFMATTDGRGMNRISQRFDNDKEESNIK